MLHKKSVRFIIPSFHFLTKKRRGQVRGRSRVSTSNKHEEREYHKNEQDQDSQKGRTRDRQDCEGKRESTPKIKCQFHSHPKNIDFIVFHDPQPPKKNNFITTQKMYIRTTKKSIVQSAKTSSQIRINNSRNQLTLSFLQWVHAPGLFAIVRLFSRQLI